MAERIERDQTATLLLEGVPRELALAALASDRYCQVSADVTNHRGGNATFLRTEMWWSVDNGVSWFRVAAQERDRGANDPGGIVWFDLQVKIPERFWTTLTHAKCVASSLGGSVNTRLRTILSDTEIDHQGQNR